MPEALFLDEKVTLNESCFQISLSFLETTTMSDKDWRLPLLEMHSEGLPVLNHT